MSIVVWEYDMGGGGAWEDAIVIDERSPKRRGQERRWVVSLFRTSHDPDAPAKRPWHRYESDPFDTGDLESLLNGVQEAAKWAERKPFSLADLLLMVSKMIEQDSSRGLHVLRSLAGHLHSAEFR